MTIALRRQLQSQAFPNVSFGPFRFLEAVPRPGARRFMRLIAFNNAVIALPAILLASIAEARFPGGDATLDRTGSRPDKSGRYLLHGTIPFDARDFLWRIGLLMLVASIAVLAAGYTSLAPHMMNGLDGMAFDQFTDIGKFWSAAVAALTLLMIVGAERNEGKVRFWEAAAEFGAQGPLGSALP